MRPSIFSILVCLLGASAAVAEPLPARWVGVGITTGARIFSSRLELGSEAAIGARITMGVSDRIMIAIDGGHSSPTRKTSNVSSSFGEVRALAAYRFLSGPVRPYLLTGLGGQFFNFHDAPGTAGAIVAAGVGVEFMAGSEWAIFGEGSVDFYRAKYQTFSDTGEVLDSTPNATYGTGLVTVGLQYRF